MEGLMPNRPQQLLFPVRREMCHEFATLRTPIRRAPCHVRHAVGLKGIEVFVARRVDPDDGQHIRPVERTRNRRGVFRPHQRKGVQFLVHIK